MWICKPLFWWNPPLHWRILPFGFETFRLDFETHMTAGVTNIIIGWGSCQSKSFGFDWQVPQPIRQAGCFQPIVWLHTALPKWADHSVARFAGFLPNMSVIWPWYHVNIVSSPTCLITYWLIKNSTSELLWKNIIAYIQPLYLNHHLS